ncbi:MAG TPA: MBL fold metallo-hydrolase, partial [Thermoanaerobaculia bacterium]|nr:MBL fold metallo-hydrolase [Thermoanaerobaculia bacterium]
ALFAALPLAGQTNLDNVKIVTEKVGGNVYILTGAGGNIGVSVGDDGIVMIDDQFAPLAPKIREALAAITSKPLRFVINTHYHGDHTGGNEPFGRDATIVAHENVRKRLAEKSPKDALPVITFNSSATVHLNGEDIRAVHFPKGHTDGDSIIWFTRSGVVHMGDHFFHDRFPYIDTDGGGTVQGYISNVDMVLATIPDGVRIIPGHGPLSDKEGLRRFAAMLKGTRDAVSNAIKSGKTLEQMKSEKVLAPWEAYSWNFIPTDRWIETLNGELRR